MSLAFPHAHLAWNRTVAFTIAVLICSTDNREKMKQFVGDVTHTHTCSSGAASSALVSASGTIASRYSLEQFRALRRFEQSTATEGGPEKRRRPGTATKHGEEDEDSL